MCKKIVVLVSPPCISENREYEYIRNAIAAYKAGELSKKVEIREETDDTVTLIYHR